MEEKKEKIIEIGRLTIEQKGLQNTSIADLAKACNISKATFYKLFDSKEDLIGQILLTINEQVTQEIRSVNKRSDCTEKDKLEQKIIIVSRIFVERMIFTTYIQEQFTKAQWKQIVAEMSKSRSELLSEYFDSLVAAYGEEIQSIVGDLILCIEGIIREFAVIATRGGHMLASEKVAEFVIEVVDAIVIAKKGKDGLVSLAMINEALAARGVNHWESRSRFLSILAEMKELIEKEDTHNSKEKLNQALLIIQEEEIRKDFDSLLMDAMLALLDQERCLAPYTQQLREYVVMAKEGSFN